MGVLADRVRVVAAWLAELPHGALHEQTGTDERHILVLIDGVGGLQAGPAIVRRVLRQQNLPWITVLSKWQFGVPGEIWTDLMWLSRNRRKATELARALQSWRERHPDATLNIVAFSAGAGIATFALEAIPTDALVDSFVMICPALSPTYNLAPALRATRRAYALISPHDRFILGFGTTLFGTVDRRHTAAAGLRGFRRPAILTESDAALYDRLGIIRWSPALAALGHHGGHTSWASPAFLRAHLLPLLRGTPLLPVEPVPSDRPWTDSSGARQDPAT